MKANLGPGWWGGAVSRALGVLVVSVGLCAGGLSAGAADDCLDCHNDRDLHLERRGEKVSLFVDAQQVSRSVHGSFSCTNCHEGLDGASFPHADPIKPVDCLSCHENLAASHGFHRDFRRDPLPKGLTTDCAACHGTHGIVAVSSSASPFRPDRQPRLCGQCHEEAAAHYGTSAHGQALAAGAVDAPNCLSCHRTPVTRDGGTALQLKLDQSRLCTSCHLDNPRVAGKTRQGAMFIASYGQSAHGTALARGNAAAANCVDCHGSHEMNKAMVADSMVNKLHLGETCARCHEAVATEFATGVHAAALQRGNLDAPACTDCHGEHNILVHTDPKSPVAARNVSQMLCGDCHASVKLSRKYGLASDRFQTFADSYHGLAVRGGAVEAVNCASCHGAHGIHPSSDPVSPVNKANLARTCGQCHPGANELFAVGTVHVTMDPGDGEPILFWIATLYLWAIGLIVGGMAVHNLADFVKKIRRKIAIQKGEIAEEILPHRLYLRMTVNERLQHGTLVISFVVLVITGFMLRYPDAWWVATIRGWSDHVFEWRSLLHRIAAVVMCAAGVWHVAYLAFTARGRQLFLDLWPRRRDLTEAIGVMRYNFGLAREKPKFDRFSYIEKAEYWALIWGSVLMTLTGVFLWFENTSMGLFTKLGYDISRTIHFYEAILATLAIIVWHFYFVIFNPDVYPMNLSWLTGYLSEKEMHEDHPLELERIKQQKRDEAVAAIEPTEPPRPPG